MTRTASARAKDKATKLHSVLVRARADGRCEWCGEARRLECSHIVGRSYNHTRTDLDNGLALCGSCHRAWHRQGPEMLMMIDELIGRPRFDALWAKAHSGVNVKFDWPAELARLEEIARTTVSEDA